MQIFTTLGQLKGSGLDPPEKSTVDFLGLVTSIKSSAVQIKHGILRISFLSFYVNISTILDSNELLVVLHLLYLDKPNQISS